MHPPPSRVSGAGTGTCGTKQRLEVCVGRQQDAQCVWACVCHLRARPESPRHVGPSDGNSSPRVATRGAAEHAADRSIAGSPPSNHTAGKVHPGGVGTARAPSNACATIAPSHPHTPSTRRATCRNRPRRQGRREEGRPADEREGGGEGGGGDGGDGGDDGGGGGGSNGAAVAASWEASAPPRGAAAARAVVGQRRQWQRQRR
jgi:hypothetical protein